MELQNIGTTTTWNEAASRINSNNQKIGTELMKLGSATYKNKGYFKTFPDLQSAFPTATVGSKAYVGFSYPYAIYLWENNSWVNSGATGGDDSALQNAVDLNTEQTIIAAKTFRGGIDMNNTRIKNVKEPADSTDAANKQYVDSKIDDIPVDMGLGVESIVQKSDNNAYGKSSVVLGHGNTAGNIDKIITDPNDAHRGDEDAGYGALATGLSSIAKGRASHSEGEGCKAEGAQSHAEGNHTTASGKVSHSEGSYTTASGEHSHAEGNYTKALGAKSHAEGDWTEASGSNSHAEGEGCIASGAPSHAEGNHTTASGNRSHAEGNYTTASGEHSHSEGDHTEASNHAAHSEGARTTASGVGSHVEGIDNKATTRASHAEGLWTKTSNEAEHAQGKYNKSNTGTIHSIGIGTSDSLRKNAVEVMQNGDVYIVGVGNYQGTSISSATPLANFINSIQSDLNELSSRHDMDMDTISFIESLAMGAQKALVYKDYSTLVTSLNAGIGDINVGQSIYIQQLDVPDLWFSNIRDPSDITEYTYTNDDDFLEYIKGGGWIGCYQLSLLETAKVDLSNTASKAEVTALQAEVAALKAIINEITTKE